MRPSDSNTSDPASSEKTFRGWRLIGVILCVVVVVAVVSAIIDWAVIGPLEGRVL